MRTANLFILIALVAASLIFGCSSEKKGANDFFATVNGEPVYLSDLLREISIKAKQNPSLKINKETLDNVVDILIERQLIIQEALKKDMAEEETFVNSIKAFWEQTLIRNFIEFKNREFEDYIFVTDADIAAYYDELEKKGSGTPPLQELYDQIKEIVLHQKKAETFDVWLAKKKKESKINVDRKLISEQLLK
ncbi:MAG: hypothetical protein ABID09_07455 [Candidatus Omnitrophota bacterium]